MSMIAYSKQSATTCVNNGTTKCQYKENESLESLEGESPQVFFFF